MALAGENRHGESGILCPFGRGALGTPFGFSWNGEITRLSRTDAIGMKKYRIGVIGAGARGEAFARSLYEGTSRAELFGLCDLDEDRLKKFVDYCDLDEARLFTDPADFFSQREMDAVVITTPDFTHRDVACQAMRTGKHIYIEKPLAPTAEQCREMIRCQQETGVTAYVGFNMRAITLYERLKEILDSGILGRLVHIEGLEHLSVPHSASFMRRFHRKRGNTGGILNHKCSHDLDIMQWLIGHEHRIVKVASFAGLNVFTPDKAPAAYCHECPSDIYQACPYKDVAGFVFPVRGDRPIHHRKRETYGGDLCVYNDDKEIFDNQTVILEWEHGLRGNFNLQLFQNKGGRETRIWGEKGGLHAVAGERRIRIVRSETGEVIEHQIPPARGGHGGSDPKMLGRFVAALDRGNAGDSGLAQGMAATLLAEKAVQSALTGRVMPVVPEDYEAGESVA
jgi:predicted dehydrogenase